MGRDGRHARERRMAGQGDNSAIPRGKHNIGIGTTIHIAAIADRTAYDIATDRWLESSWSAWVFTYLQFQAKVCF